MNWIILFSLISILTLSKPSLSSASEIPAQLKALHVLNRLGFGPRPGDIERVNAMGVENYIHQQLYPETIPEPPRLIRELDKLTTYSLDPVALVREYRPSSKLSDPVIIKKLRKRSNIIVDEASRARLMRAIESPRQLQEVMVDFWYNHFNVDSSKGMDHFWVGNYERRAIRPYVLGRFRDLLEATAKHPAMLFYLDNWVNLNINDPGKSANFGLNENYARELMELHTLGVDGGYTQDDVNALEHILTGWGFSAIDYSFNFNEGFHDNTDKVFLGQTFKGDGQQEVERALDLLAKSPQTARHISFQLAQYFVSENPDPALVERLAKKFEDTDGDIRAVLQAIFDSPQFWDERNYGNKLKTPYQYIISLVRATGKEVTDFVPLVIMLQKLGMPLYKCETPDGYKNTPEEWLSSDGILRRVNFAAELSMGMIKINGDRLPVDYNDLIPLFNDQLSPSAREAVQNAPAELRAMLVLGSPDMMNR